jgi:hypothetical protein
VNSRFVGSATRESSDGPEPPPPIMGVSRAFLRMHRPLTGMFGSACGVQAERARGASAIGLRGDEKGGPTLARKKASEGREHGAIRWGRTEDARPGGEGPRADDATPRSRRPSRPGLDRSQPVRAAFERARRSLNRSPDDPATSAASLVRAAFLRFHPTGQGGAGAQNGGLAGGASDVGGHDVGGLGGVGLKKRLHAPPALAAHHQTEHRSQVPQRQPSHCPRRRPEASNEDGESSTPPPPFAGKPHWQTFTSLPVPWSQAQISMPASASRIRLRQ